MRCKHCNVDLPETYKTCPLCANETTDEEAVIKNMKAVPYSKDEPSEASRVKKEKPPFSMEKVKAYFNL